MSLTEKFRILLVDDHPIVRDGIRRLIEMSGEMTVCGETGNGNEVMGLIAKENPSVVLLDLSLEGADGLSLIGQIGAKYPAIAVLVLSMHSETTYALRCIQAGAHGYLMKKSASREIVNAISTVLQGNIYVSETAKELIFRAVAEPKRLSKNPIDQLSPREFQVFRLYGEGLKTSQIAGKLQCSPKTVETHSLRIRYKMGLQSLSELIAEAGANAKISISLL